MCPRIFNISFHETPFCYKILGIQCELGKWAPSISSLWSQNKPISTQACQSPKSKSWTQQQMKYHPKVTIIRCDVFQLDVILNVQLGIIKQPVIISVHSQFGIVYQYDFGSASNLQIGWEIAGFGVPCKLLHFLWMKLLQSSALHTTHENANCRKL